MHLTEIPHFIFQTIPIPVKMEWTDVVVAIFTMGLFAVAWWQLGGLRKTAKADFAHRLGADYYTAECAKLEDQLTDSKIAFDVATRTFTGRSGIAFNARDLDRHILGPLESVGVFQKRRLLDVEFVYDFFGSSILNVMQNKEVQAYISWRRQQPYSADVYECLLFLERECLELTEAKERGAWAVMRWKFRSEIRSWIFRR